MAQILWILWLLFAQEDSDLSTSIDALIEQSRIPPPAIGIALYSEKRGDYLYRRNATQPFVLASNTKLFTAAAALEHLPPDHLLSTCLSAQNVANGTATALVVTGDGNPHLSGRDFQGNPTAIFESWARDLRTAGITRVEGPLLLVVDKFDLHPSYPGWSSYPSDQWWAAPIAQFALNDNCIDVEYAPGGKAGNLVSLTLQPDTRYVTIVNKKLF